MLTLMFSLPLFLTTAFSAPSRSEPSRNLSDFARTHSSTHSFQQREGWDTVPASDLAYRHLRNNSTAPKANHPRVGLEKRSRKNKTTSGGGIGGAVQHVVDAALKPIGNIEEVTITWYTGNDLKNPSCWSDSHWAPSDASFACAVTLEGWKDRPECFKFLELCNADKCIFVRVVDTCAGCAKGSKHVDLTKAAFEALASLDKGRLEVKMRRATDPHHWDESLWGPRNA